MKIRKAVFEDLGMIIEIFKNAIVAMNKNNIPQWDELYPNDRILEEDILKEQMYVGIIDDTIVSAAVVNSESDDEYKNGDWKYINGKFAVIHRLCVDPIYQNQKAGKKMMLEIEELLRKDGVQSIRLDAFSLNPYALKMYEMLGYQKVGQANWRKGLFYLFEKKL